MRCILVGECMVEFAPAGQAGLFRHSIAGDTFNTAWYLARHAPHLNVSYLTTVGRDKFSDRFLEQCDSAGIGRSHVARHPERPLGSM